MPAAINLALLHGGGQGSWVWEQTIAALSQRPQSTVNRVLALDVPGCGSKRGRETTRLTVDDIADELLADISAAGLENVVLVGHSLAGTLLPRMVERLPALFRRLVYVSCTAPLPGKTVVQTIGRDVHGSHPDEVGWPLDPAIVPQQQQYRAMFCNDMESAEADAFLARLGKDRWPDDVMSRSDWRYAHLATGHATFIVCLRDNILTPPWQETFAARVGADRIVRIDAGHQVMNTQPQAMAKALLAAAALATQDT